MGKMIDEYKPNQMTYDLRRLRMHGLIEKIPKTKQDIQVCTYLSKIYLKLTTTGLGQIVDVGRADENRSIRKSD